MQSSMKNNNITLNEKKSMSMKSKKAIMGSIFIAPALIFIFIFLLLPAILAFIYSFQNYNMLKPHAKVFVALQNYMEILKDPAFYKVLKNTVYFAAIVVPAQSAVALLLALIVNAKIKTSKVARICFFSPVITSMVVVSILWTFLYNKDNGMINSFLSQLGIPAQPFLLSEKQAMNSIIIMSIWQIDGANWWQKFTNVTLPGIQHVSNFVILMTTIQAFKLFTQPYIMTGGGPNESTKTLAYMIYEQGFQYRNVGYSCAIAVLFFLIITVVSGILKKLIMKEED